MALSELAEKFYNLRQERDKIEENLKEINNSLSNVERDMLEEFGHQGLTRVDVRDKGTFSVATRKFFKAEDKDELMKFLQSEGATDLLSVNHQTLNAWAKELKDRYGEDFQIPGVGETSHSQIRMTKAK